MWPHNNPLVSKEFMDKKQKKRLDVLQKKMQQLRQKLAGVKEQADEPGEVEAVEKEMAAVTAEIEKIKAS